MAEFSRIRVTPAEEEDIVIRAGAIEEPEATPSASAEKASSSVNAGLAETVVLESAPVVSGGRDEYEETTLADLQRTRMSGMQKAIIAIAFVALAAFIIWYVLLH